MYVNYVPGHLLVIIALPHTNGTIHNSSPPRQSFPALLALSTEYRSIASRPVSVYSPHSPVHSLTHWVLLLLLHPRLCNWFYFLRALLFYSPRLVAMYYSSMYVYNLCDNDKFPPKSLSLTSMSSVSESVTVGRRRSYTPPAHPSLPRTT